MSTRGNEKSPLELPKCPGVYCSQPSNISRVFNIDGKPVSYCNGDWCWTSAQKELLPDIPGTWYMIFYPPALKTTVSKTAVDSHSDIHIPWTLSRGIGEVCKADESSLTNTNIPLVPDDGLPEVTTYTKVQDMFWYRPFAPEGKMFVAFSPEINSILANGFAMPSLARSFKRLLQISKQFEYTKDGVVVKLIRQVYRPAGYSQLQNLASHILYQFRGVAKSWITPFPYQPLVLSPAAISERQCILSIIDTTCNISEHNLGLIVYSYLRGDVESLKSRYHSEDRKRELLMVELALQKDIAQSARSEFIEQLDAIDKAVHDEDSLRRSINYQKVYVSNILKRDWVAAAATQFQSADLVPKSRKRKNKNKPRKRRFSVKRRRLRPQQVEK